MSVVFTRKAADFNVLHTHRYCLEREWAPSKPKLVCVGINPSDADDVEEDPTIRKVVGFADRWGFGGIIMVNQYGFVATKPPVMRQAIKDKGERYVIGEVNDHVLLRVFGQNEAVWFAWGANGAASRSEAVLALARACKREPFCIGTAMCGNPLHPLMQPYKAERRPWNMPAAA